MTAPVTHDTLRVLIVDDHELIAQGVAVALEADDVEVQVSTGPTTDDVLAVTRRIGPHVVLLDLQLDGPIGSGIELIEPLRELGADVLILTGVTDRMELARCLERGAAGVTSKSEPFDHLVDKVLKVGRGETVMPEGDRIQMLQELHEHQSRQRELHAPFRDLTPKEAQVLGQLVQGHQADAIAEHNYVSIATVRSQIRSILQKLGVNSQLAAVALARELGWEPPTRR